MPASSEQAQTQSEPPTSGSAASHTQKSDIGFFGRVMRSILGSQEDRELKEALAEVISDSHETDEDVQIAHHQRLLISNVLKLKDECAYDVMVARSDIAGLEVNTPQEQILSVLAQKQFSRFPVYRETMDTVLGTVHIKDILQVLSAGEAIDLVKLVRDVPIIAPSMPLLDLLLLMRQERRHMVLIIDEYGGIDGLVTINDIVENIVGDIDDEYEDGLDGEMHMSADGTILADGRVEIENFEESFGSFVTESEREEDIDTLGGLVVLLAGRVPARGEVIAHSSGTQFEIVEADTQRIMRLRVRLPVPAQSGV